MDGTGVLLGDFTEELRRYCNVHLVSYPEDKALGYQALTEIVRANLPKHEPYVIVGESFSGPIALTLAAERPPNLIGTVLSCSFARSPARFLGLMAWLMRAYPRRLISIALIGSVTLGRWFTPGMQRSLSTLIRRIPSRVWASRLQAMASLDLAHIEGRISTPLLYLHATEDKLVDAKEAAYVRALVPSMEQVGFEAPHLLLQVRPGEAAAHIANFFGW
jgi:pimeloyl-ACP methyl ester carboxylesterase